MAQAKLRDTARNNFFNEDGSPRNDFMINEQSEFEYSDSQIGSFSRATSRPSLEKVILPNLDHQNMMATARAKSVMVDRFDDSHEQTAPSQPSQMGLDSNKNVNKKQLPPLKNNMNQISLQLQKNRNGTSTTESFK